MVVFYVEKAGIFVQVHSYGSNFISIWLGVEHNMQLICIYNNLMLDD